jgi:hypothetical protein
LGEITYKFCFGNKEAAKFSFLGIHKWEPDIYVGFSPALHLQCDAQRFANNILYLNLAVK